MIIAIILSILLVTIISISVWVISLRRVVSTNEVHIVQTAKTSISYGKNESAGNTYYNFPSWLPRLGIQTIRFPISVFSEQLTNYEAYDKGRLPFILDLAAFFRICDSGMAAQRVSSFSELRTQLSSILQGAARTILASKDIEEIMQGRAEFGAAFTTEVDEQLQAWGVCTVKSIELMDIRDGRESRVIANIMDKKKSFIEMQSRQEVANNKKLATNAEVDADREVQLNRQEAEQRVGIRTAEKEKQVGLAQEITQQEVLQQQKVTTEHLMQVKMVEDTKTAEIAKQVQVVQALQRKETDVIIAEGQKQKVVLEAEANLETKLKESQGIKAEGEARAAAEEKMQLAPVNAQITLAKEIGENINYQNYLVTVEQINAVRDVGLEQAGALKTADLKFIINSGDAQSAMDTIPGTLTSSKGGQGIASMLEGLAQTDIGQQVISKFLTESPTTTKPSKSKTIR